MTQPLNYTPKAMEALRWGIVNRFEPQDIAAAEYILGKLEAAQVFVLPENGAILDRTKVPPTLPGKQLRPPFDVVALEYPAAWNVASSGVKSTRRIALVWQWEDDLPDQLRELSPSVSGDGVVVMSIAYFDEPQVWSSPTLATFLSYEQEITPFENDIEITQSWIGVMPSAIEALARRPDAQARIEDLKLDLREEVRAYFDLCCALSCRNVVARETPAPAALNRQRQRTGKQPLKGFHVLQLGSGGNGASGGGSVGDRSGPRSHLRRGHIRRLRDDRTTWVNSSVVRGRGFVDKVYAL